MCTTWLGARLIRDLTRQGYRIIEARLIRLNPTIPHRTRGNAAIAVHAYGDPDHAFTYTCELVQRYAALDCEKTHPGVVLADYSFPPYFYQKAVSAICTISEAEDVLRIYARAWKGFKLGRGLIGATAAIASVLDDNTWEYLAYREPKRWGTPRDVDETSLFTAEEVTTPHTWDSVDTESMSVVCVPHTPDPVLFGIRGDSPFPISRAVSCIRSELIAWGQFWITNQGTDAHLLDGTIGSLQEGSSYRVKGMVADAPSTARGGHVRFAIQNNNKILQCMAFEPTKGFRNKVRALLPGDQILAVGTYLKDTLNLEKFFLYSGPSGRSTRAPFCTSCQKQMTSAGSGKGYKCRKCGSRIAQPEIVPIIRTILPGWYEVPPCARRHLAKPLIRDIRKGTKESLQGDTDF
jgi:tRNA(Ile2)-agmatinylcytidine synthase